MTAFVMWICAAITAAGSPPEAATWWDAQVAASLDRAPARKTEWVRLLETCPREHRPGLAYLIKYLPVRDLETLRPAALADNLALAYRHAPWFPGGPGYPMTCSMTPSCPTPASPSRATRCGPSFTPAICPW